MTFYRNLSSLLKFGDYSMKGRTYRYLEEKPLYPFGFGLNYGKVELSGGEVEGHKARVTVKNLSERNVREVLEVYVDPVDSPDRVAHYSLCGFLPVTLKPGEERRVEITLGEHTYECVNEEGRYVKNASSYVFYIGTSQPDERSMELGAPKPLTVICGKGE